MLSFNDTINFFVYSYMTWDTSILLEWTKRKTFIFNVYLIYLIYLYKVSDIRVLVLLQ